MKFWFPDHCGWYFFRFKVSFSWISMKLNQVNITMQCSSTLFRQLILSFALFIVIICFKYFIYIMIIFSSMFVFFNKKLICVSNIKKLIFLLLAKICDLSFNFSIFQIFLQLLSQIVNSIQMIVDRLIIIIYDLNLEI
jgi:hypothetical protein